VFVVQGIKVYGLLPHESDAMFAAVDAIRSKRIAACTPAWRRRPQASPPSSSISASP
jgi:hypothetical protein